jgi:hypothetical protein
MNYLKISNIGEIDVEALTLLGASSKRDQSNKIGQWGSGNKYALAYFLRNNFDIQIYSGSKKITLTTTPKKLRNKEFDVISIDGIDTSITTEFGFDWSLWQAIREIYCNSIDEGNHKLEYVSSIDPQDGETHFYIKSRNEITNFISRFDDYFSENKKVLFECKYGRILEKSNDTLNLYRRGVRCFDTNKHSLYDYDLTDIDIDENRLVKYTWQVPSKIWNLVYMCNNKEVIRNILQNCTETNLIEYFTDDFSSPSASFMSDEFKEVIKELKLAPSGMAGLLSVEEMGITTIIPSKIFNQVKPIVSNDNLANKFKIYKDSFYVEIEQTPLHTATLKKAFDFFNECKYNEVLDYDVVIARFDRKDILGFADTENQKIVLSEICLDKGTQNVIETMIEEFIHLKYQVSDETRGFQDAAITEIVKLLKVKNTFLL